MTKIEPLENLVSSLEKEYGCLKQESYESARSLIGLMELFIEIDERNKRLENKECGDYPHYSPHSLRR